jgi:alpha-maltose-1-phosphate synthase
MAMDSELRGRRLRALFVNENIGGHAAMHRYLRASLEGDDRIEATFLDVPSPGLFRRVIGAPVPGLGALDADFQPLRYQLAQSMWVRRRIRRWQNPYDALHVYTHNAALLVPEELAAGPSVVSTDCTNEQNARTLPYRNPSRYTSRALGLTRRYEERVYAAATIVVAQSEYAARSLREDYGVPEDRLRVIPFGVTIPRPRVRAEATPAEITFVGSSLERKGGKRLLAIHRASLADRYLLNIVTRERVRGAEGVRVYHDVSPGDGQLEAILDRTAVFAFPSEIDKSSYSVLEAMAAGVPVVAVRHGAVDELVEDGVTGLVVERGDDAGFANALARLLVDDALRAEMGLAARERAERLFDARTTTSRLIEVLEEARQRSAGRKSTVGAA